MSTKLQRIRRVLSIQSHVVHGFVGNKCTASIRQLYGFEVDTINSVHFSNNTGYKTVKGNRLNADELRSIFQGLLANELLEYDYILTVTLFRCYMGSIHKENNLISACEKAISILHQILLKTIESSKPINIYNRCGNELCLIESKTIIQLAEILFHAIVHEKNMK